MDPQDRKLTAWSRELMLWWSHYNRIHAGGTMRPPTIVIDRSSARLGAWISQTRTLAIAAGHIEAVPWLEVMETLRHEMAHQYAEEVLGATSETAHGPAFQRACEILRADPRATRVEGDDTADAGSDSDSKIIDRVHKLFALGESPNENEAQVAINKAHELLLRHNIGVLGDAPGDGARRYRVRRLGPVRGRHHLHEQLIAAVLGEFFFVDVLWAHTYDASRQRRGTVLEICGTPANLDMAEYVHDFLVGVSASLWTSYRARVGLPGNRERLRYMAGVIQGFVHKLRAQERRLQREHALVWRGDPQLAAFVRNRHPHLRTTYTGGHVTGSRAFADGIEAGRNVTLHRPLTEGTDGTVRQIEG